MKIREGGGGSQTARAACVRVISGRLSPEMQLQGLGSIGNGT